MGEPILLAFLSSGCPCLSLFFSGRFCLSPSPDDSAFSSRPPPHLLTLFPRLHAVLPLSVCPCICRSFFSLTTAAIPGTGAHKATTITGCITKYNSIYGM